MGKDSLCFYGDIVKGNRIGSKIGIPTINIPVLDSTKAPSFGVYAAVVYITASEHNGEEVAIKGIANIGRKPTIEIKDEFGNLVPNPIGIEVNLFDFSDDIYGKHVKVELLEFIRVEMKFDSIEDLKRQIESDTKTVRKYFEENVI